MKSGKRDMQVGVEMSADDFAEFKRAADVLWSGAILSNSSVILGLAKLKASDVLNPGAAPKKTSLAVKASSGRKKASPDSPKSRTLSQAASPETCSPTR
jgi:hypothetical protein